MERKADIVANDLLTRIVSGELSAGCLLPKESDLAERYGVNRGVVREANKLLEVHRLVEPVRRRGTQVLDPMQSLSPDVLRAMLVRPDGSIDREVLAEFLEIRAELDVLMSGLAAERAQEEDVAALQAVLRELADVVHDPVRFSRQLNALGLAVARASHNRLFEMLAHWHRRVYADLEPLFSRSRRSAEPHLQGCRLLVEAIGRSDCEMARAITESYHRWATATLIEVSEDVLMPADRASFATDPE